MPSDESDKRASGTIAPAPTSSLSPPSSGLTAAEFATWGRVRDAVTGLHNLHTLLRSPRVSAKLLATVLPELLTSCSALRDAFTRTPWAAREPQAIEARRALSEFSLSRIDELERAMGDAAERELETRPRLALEHVVTRVSLDLDAAFELLDLAMRADHAAPTELSVGALARVSLAPSCGRGDRQVTLRFAPDAAEAALLADPHVLTRLLAFAGGRVHDATGAPDGVTLRAAVVGAHVRIAVTASTGAEGALDGRPTRVVRRLPISDTVVDASAAAAGIPSESDPARVTYALPRVE